MSLAVSKNEAAAHDVLEEVRVPCALCRRVTRDKGARLLPLNAPGNV